VSSAKCVAARCRFNKSRTSLSPDGLADIRGDKQMDAEGDIAQVFDRSDAERYGSSRLFG
jgi:hypothetical protein